MKATESHGAFASTAADTNASWVLTIPMLKQAVGACFVGGVRRTWLRSQALGYECSSGIEEYTVRRGEGAICFGNGRFPEGSLETLFASQIQALDAGWLDAVHPVRHREGMLGPGVPGARLARVQGGRSGRLLEGRLEERAGYTGTGSVGDYNTTLLGDKTRAEARCPRYGVRQQIGGLIGIESHAGAAAEPSATSRCGHLSLSRCETEFQ